MNKKQLDEIKKFGQYKHDFFQKLDFNFEQGKTLLDVGAGDCTDVLIFRDILGLNVKATDIYTNENVSKHSIDFKQASIYELPYENESFDYIFVHDVFHHIDEGSQRESMHAKALEELKRVLKKNGTLIIAEGNRYNPLFYPHMVKMLGHDHFAQAYFKNLMSKVLPEVKFKFFEAHLYPAKYLGLFKVYETIMETFIPKQFLAYNIASWTKESTNAK